MTLYRKVLVDPDKAIALGEFEWVPVEEPVYRKAPDAHERLVNWFQFMTANPWQSGDEFNKNIETAISLVLVKIGDTDDAV